MTRAVLIGLLALLVGCSDPLGDLRSPDPVTAIAAADALLDIPDEAIPVLSTQLERSTNYHVTAAMIRALGRAGPRASTAIPLITPWAVGGEGSLYLDAREALQRIRAP